MNLPWWSELAPLMAPVLLLDVPNVDVRVNRTGNQQIWLKHGPVQVTGEKKGGGGGTECEIKSFSRRPLPWTSVVTKLCVVFSNYFCSWLAEGTAAQR